MATHNFVQAAFQRVGIELASDANRPGNTIGSAVRIKLIEKQQALLGKRYREHVTRIRPQVPYLGPTAMPGSI